MSWDKGDKALYIDGLRQLRERDKKAPKPKEKTVSDIISSLEKLTKNQKTKEIPKTKGIEKPLKEIAKLVLNGLRAISKALIEVRAMRNLSKENFGKLSKEYLKYVEFWEFIEKNGKLPGIFHPSIHKYNVWSVNDLFKKLAKHANLYGAAFKKMLDNAYKKYKDSDLKYIKT